jgi:hypothetical protein
MRTLTMNEIEAVGGGPLPLIGGYKLIKVAIAVTLVSAKVSCEARK